MLLDWSMKKEYKMDYSQLQRMAEDRTEWCRMVCVPGKVRRNNLMDTVLMDPGQGCGNWSNTINERQ